MEEFQTKVPEEPVWKQFIGWATDFYRGDLGVSTASKEPVSDILINLIPRSLLLLLPGTIAGFLLGIWLGKRIAWQRRGWLEFVATLGGTAFYTSFPPWLAFVIINVFGLSLGWFPPEKIVDPVKWFGYEISLNAVIMRMFLTVGVAGLFYLIIERLTRHQIQFRSFIRLFSVIGITLLTVITWIVSGYGPLAVDILYHLILPIGTLTLLSFGETMLVMRATMVEAMAADHIPTAQAKGMHENMVRDRHVARIAILPVLARFIVHLPLVIIGSFILEREFFWGGGLGQVLFSSAQDNDLPVLMGILSVVGVGILLAHIILDLLNLWLDPRLRKIEGAEVDLQITS
jgi:peptide/nickel transport system permease protein